MLTQTAINQLGNFHIRTCHKSMWSNGKDMLGGSFKSKSQTPIVRTPSEGLATSFPSEASQSSRKTSSKLNAGLPTVCAAENPTPTLLHQCCEDLGVDYIG